MNVTKVKMCANTANRQLSMPYLTHLEGRSLPLILVGLRLHGVLLVQSCLVFLAHQLVRPVLSDRGYRGFHQSRQIRAVQLHLDCHLHRADLLVLRVLFVPRALILQWDR